MNGRIITNINNPKEYKIYKEKKNIDNSTYYKDALTTVLEPTHLQCYFFSESNINHLQNMIIHNVYHKSNKKHIISKQDDNELKTIMKSIYLQYSKNINNNYKEQINILNNHVLTYCISNILTNIEMYLSYKKVVNKMPEPIELPKNTSKFGTKTNPNFIY